MRRDAPPHKSASSASNDSRSKGPPSAADRHTDSAAAQPQQRYRRSFDEHSVAQELAAAALRSNDAGAAVQPVVRTLRQHRKRSTSVEGLSSRPSDTQDRAKGSAIQAPTPFANASVAAQQGHQRRGSVATDAGATGLVASSHSSEAPPVAEPSSRVAVDVGRASEEAAKTKTYASSSRASIARSSLHDKASKEVAQPAPDASACVVDVPVPLEHRDSPATREPPTEDRPFAAHARRVSFTAEQVDSAMTALTEGRSASASAQRGRRRVSVPGEELESTISSLPTGAGQSDPSGQRPSHTSTGFSDQQQSRLEDLLPLSRQKENGKEAPWLRHPALTMAVVVLTTIALVVLFNVLRGGRTKDDELLCGTPDCIDHANILGLKGRRPPPCTGFGDFVCSGWKANTRGISTAVTADALFSWVETVEKMSIGDFDRQAVVNRPLSMMRKCMVRTDGGGQGAVTRLIDFVDGSSFAWPTAGDDRQGQIVDYGRPLQLLLELSVSWALPLWFRARMVPAVASARLQLARRAIVFTPSALASIWRTVHVTLTDYEAYPAYLSYFNETVFKYRPPSPSFASFLVGRSAHVQTVVLNKLSEVFDNPFMQPRLLEIRGLPKRVRNLDAEVWMRTLQSVFGGNGTVTTGDLILTTSDDLLNAMDFITEANSAQDIFFHTIWWFLQFVGAATSDRLFQSASDHPQGKRYQQTICFAHVDTTYNALLASISKALMSTHEHLAIANQLENIRAIALEKLRSYFKHSAETREALSAVLEGMSTVIWPEDDFGRPGGFEQYFGEPYRGQDGFFGEWRWSRLQRQARNSAELSWDTQYYVAFAETYAAGSSHLTAYNPVRNAIFISVAALRPPFYYKGATSAMMYAGLGYLYAEGIFNALNTMVHLFDGGTTMQLSDKPSTRAFWEASSCPRALGAQTFPALLALDVAYTAYLRFRNETSDLRLKGLPEYSPEQVFFATFCHGTCWAHDFVRKESSVCNQATQNFPLFMKAFSCNVTAEMMPYAKCMHD
ncbi:uncharacterized protein LOC142588797 [Dermacentor variabilis]|uniref:uncharacterized protein LOC142588797 n=1 Tax=Dermacentor variabilis TaxID=34621 RepID=UPI003F5B4C22